jgi:ABC-2 type transport system permease protein
VNGFAVFMRKELLEIPKTWRLWVLPGILVFLGLTTPILAAATPYLLKMTTQGQAGVVIKLPTPTSLEAYTQFMGNLVQLALLAVIVTGAGVVTGERRSGTAALMLSKPLTRAGFIVAKALSSLLILFASTALGAAICVLVTVILFDSAHVASFLASVLVWLALATMFATMMVFLSAAMDRQAPAAGTGIAVYVALFVLTGFPAVRDRTPAGLLAANDALLSGRHVALALPLSATLVLAVVLVGAAVIAFRRKEL